MIRLLFSDPIQFLGAFLAFIIAIMSHECAHGLAALHNGDYTAKDANRINFNPANHFDLFGALMFVVIGFGYAKPVPINSRNFDNYKKGMIQTSLAGVVMNLLIAFVAYPIYVLLSRVMPDILLLDEFIKFFFLYLFFVNIWLAVFNILPIPPLDGFNLIATLAPSSRYVRFMYRNSRYAIWGLILILFLGDFINVPQLNIISYVSSFIIKGIQGLWGLIL